MEIARHFSRRRFVEVLQYEDRLLECLARLQRFEIADVLADYGRSVVGQATVFFRWAPTARIGRSKAGLGDRPGRVAAGAPHDHRLAPDNADDGIVDMTRDGPIVDEEDIGDSAQPSHRFVFIRADRFVGKIPAGGHHGETEFLHQNVVERSVG